MTKKNNLDLKLFQIVFKFTKLSEVYKHIGMCIICLRLTPYSNPRRQLIKILYMVQMPNILIKAFIQSFTPKKLYISKKLNCESSAVTLKARGLSLSTSTSHVILWQWMLTRTDGGVLAHVPLTAHAARVGPPRTPEFWATQFRKKGEREDHGGNQ